ncbi:pyridoxal phosphate-dependent aminotransferase [Solibacillus sp. MA9]|uniref:cysteine-S-conjugate beta-lyase n=1 Tax=Solibacillus palustris TaxID=2908203 RepID=A0ABS9UFC2_9BACL|nr:MalY/PatB family protein [Solibacillus sp. MA9]MCH7323042.1 pyridoxal phosphate-dependent aminotransferase [Solibacillus sp. MA9]
MSFFNEIHERRNSSSIKWDKMCEVYNLENTSELLPMWIADMDFPAPTVVSEAITERLKHPIFGYTFENCKVKDATVQWYQTRHNWTIDPDTILFQSGVVPAIATIVETFTKKGDKIGMATPAYPPFFNIPNAQQREIITCELTEQDGQYFLNFEKLEQIFQSDIKMYILCNPHNPIGIVWSREQLEELVALCIKYDVYLLADEIHADILIKKSYTPTLTVKNADNAKIIACIAPTKTFNIAGIHAAMMIASNKELFDALKSHTEAHGQMGLNVFACTTVEAVYTKGAPWLDELLPYIKNNMDYVVTELNAIPGICVSIPDATYLMWIDYRGTGLEENEIMHRLIHKGLVALDPGTKYGKAGQGFLRMNVACPFDLVKQGVEGIKKALQ